MIGVDSTRYRELIRDQSFFGASPSFLPLEQLSADFPAQQEDFLSPSLADFEEQQAAAELSQDFPSLALFASFEHLASLPPFSCFSSMAFFCSPIVIDDFEFFEEDFMSPRALYLSLDFDIEA